ncbi:MAG: hypothetical protein IPI46_14865 [Bacteroidetes bacterium]|nr:hypothetical protein [Bacteroidota bacterium]
MILHHGVGLVDYDIGLFLGGIQLLSIGIVGEYISRIQSDVRKRPLYVLRDTEIWSNDASETLVKPIPYFVSADTKCLIKKRHIQGALKY